MKIAFVTDAIWPFTIGGSEVRNHEVAKRLVKKGHEVHIIGAKFWKGKRDIEIEGVKIHGLHNYARLYNPQGKRKLIDPLILSSKIFLYLLKDDFDLIDNASFVYFNCYTTKIVSLLKRVPLIFTWHQYFGDYLLEYFGKLKGAIAIILESTSAKLTKHNVAVSSYIKDELIRQGVHEKNIFVINNGADISLINSIKSKKKKYDLIFVGRLNYQKNLPLLVESVRLLSEEYPKIRVCIVGGGVEQKNIQRLVEKYGLNGNFHFTGELRDKKKVFEHMKSSRIFVLPSRLEGFPLTIVEANACGVPVVAARTKHNDISEYVRNGENGLVAGLNPVDFSDAIGKLLKDKKKVKFMSKRSILKAKEYDWDKIADRQEKYYQEVLK